MLGEVDLRDWMKEDGEQSPLPDSDKKSVKSPLHFVAIMNLMMIEGLCPVNSSNKDSNKNGNKSRK